jgi:hypothetical protein
MPENVANSATKIRIAFHLASFVAQVGVDVRDFEWLEEPVFQAGPLTHSLHIF